jgi:hypothetical protein
MIKAGDRAAMITVLPCPPHYIITGVSLYRHAE